MHIINYVNMHKNYIKLTVLINEEENC